MSAFGGKADIGRTERNARQPIRFNALFTMLTILICARLTKNGTDKEQFVSESPTEWRSTVDPDKRSAWLKKLDAECPYQVVLPRRQLTDDSEIVNFLLSYAGKFDMYVEDECAAYVRYCFKDPMDAAIFRSRFESKSKLFRLAG